MGSERDLLADAVWECAATAPGEAAGPDQLDLLRLSWLPATVPGTAAGALAAAGRPEPNADELDGKDWWFRTAVDAEGPTRTQEWFLELDGLATVADVWLDRRLVHHSETMFAGARVPVEGRAGVVEVHIRCAALRPLLAARRPRPRWKTGSVGDQHLRWFRTTLLGRQRGWTVTPAPVGPWRAVRLVPRAGFEPSVRRVVATCTRDGRDSTAGTVSVELTGIGDPGEAPLVEVGQVVVPLSVDRDGERVVLSATVDVGPVDRWWPHTHGDQPLYPVVATVGDGRLALGSVGFRTVELDDREGGFTLSVNGTPLFARGACWYPTDPVTFAASEAEVTATLEEARRAGMNMVRVPGGTVYPDEHFYASCDRLGILVWQDAMLAFVDPPDDEESTEVLASELRAALDTASAHPSLAVVCGGQELEEQPAMFGLARSAWTTPLLTDVFAKIAAEHAPGCPYLPSSPTGGDPPFRVDTGVSHYAGVGVFARPLDDLRRAAPRFVSEGLAFAVPPEASVVDRRCGGARLAGHDPGWKRAVHHDTGGSWDLEDVRDHYVTELFGVDARLERRRDPERALDLGRAVACEVVSAALSEWRRPGSSCAGLLVVALRDLRMGAGWGLLDADGGRKAPWYAFARAASPVAVLATDEGLNGLHLHLVNDTAEAVTGTLVVSLATDRHVVEEARRPVELPPRGASVVVADELFDGFRDLTYAYRFGPRAYELISIAVVDPDGATVAATTYLPGGPSRPLEADVGLQIELDPVDGTVWSLSISTRRFAQFVCIDLPDHLPADSWFHLPPGATRVVGLTPRHAGAPTPRGQVRALNSRATVGVTT